jgi:hypothetical protein
MLRVAPFQFFKPLIVILTFVVAGFLIWWIIKPKPLPLIEGRPLANWVQEVEIEAPGEKQIANEVLYAEGPRIVPILSRLLLQHESALVARLPRALVGDTMRQRYENQIRLQTKAGWIISVIAYRAPESPEVREAIPSLTGALESRSEQVRSVSAQGLAAIGPSASNAIPRLILRTHDHSASVRMCAVEALGRIGRPSSALVSAVRTALSDTNNDVRFIATQALARVQRNIK